MPYVTEHASKVSTRTVESYANESSREKRQQDRQTDGQTHRRIVENHFSTPPNENPPTAKCWIEKSTNCKVLDPKTHQLQCE